MPDGGGDLPPAFLRLEKRQGFVDIGDARQVADILLGQKGLVIGLPAAVKLR